MDREIAKAKKKTDKEFDHLKKVDKKLDKQMDRMSAKCGGMKKKKK